MSQEQSQDGAVIATAIGTNMLVKPVKKTAGDMVIAKPDIVPEERPEVGVVVQTGHLVNKDVYRFGTKVCFSPRSGREFLFNNEMFMILDESEILVLLS